MVSNLEKLSSSLRTAGDPEKDDARRLVEKIKSDPQVRSELERTGSARVQDDAGRSFVVRRKAVEVTAAGQ